VDNSGNRTSKTDKLANVTSNYAYDPIYQLTGVTQGVGTTESYTYTLSATASPPPPATTPATTPTS
jgi:hypothetical protein